MIKTSRRIAETLRKVQATPAFVAERVKLAFAVALDEKRKTSGLNYVALARQVGASPAYVTKVFRGDCNLTIESMVKLAMAVGSEIDIRLVDRSAQTGVTLDWCTHPVRGRQRFTLVPNSASVSRTDETTAANREFDGFGVAA